MAFSPIQLLQRANNSNFIGYEQAAAVLGLRGLNSKLSRLVTNGQLIRLKRGLFVLAPEYRNKPLELFPLANLLYGPSYVSLESALAHYGLIPEHAFAITSVTHYKGKIFDTALGRFSYRVITPTAFPVGVKSELLRVSRALIATPEKALLDKVYLDASKGDLFAYCSESLRLDQTGLRRLSRRNLKSLAKSYGSPYLVGRIEEFCSKIEQHKK